jgi:DNA-binding transcriptional MerR regulator
VSNLYTIGEIAREAGFEAQTVRYYERRGLLMPLERSSSGYRLYDKGAVKRLLFICRAKDLGFTLAEIKDLLELKADDINDCGVAKAKAEAKLKDIEEKIASLESVREVLKDIIDKPGELSASGECPILKAIDEER